MMDASQGVYMDTAAVRQIANRCATVGEFLHGTSKILEGLMNKLKDTAFVGEVGGSAVVIFIETIQPQIELVVAKCQELNQDLNASVQAYEQGDQEGATRFY